jgi:hypothetical protein
MTRRDMHVRNNVRPKTPWTRRFRRGVRAFLHLITRSRRIVRDWALAPISKGSAQESCFALHELAQLTRKMDGLSRIELTCVSADQIEVKSQDDKVPSTLQCDDYSAYRVPALKRNSEQGC